MILILSSSLRPCSELRTTTVLPFASRSPERREIDGPGKGDIRSPNALRIASLLTIPPVCSSSSQSWTGGANSESIANEYHRGDQ
jgi:hypothetical protein